MKSKHLFLIIAISLLLIFSYFILFWDNLSNDDVAGHTLKWIDEQYLGDGNYVYSISCSDEDVSCDSPEVTKDIYNENGYIAWAHYKAYLSTKDDKYLDLILENLVMLKDENLQIDRWACRFIYEIYMSEEMPQNIRDEAKKVCLAEGFMVVDGYSDFLSEYDILSLMNAIRHDSTESLISKVDLSSRDDDIVFNFKYFAHVASEMVYLSKFEETANINYVFYAEESYRDSLFSFLFLEEKAAYDYSILGIAAYDLYKVTDNSDYLSFVKYLFDESYKITILNGNYDANDLAHLIFFYDNVLDEYKHPDFDREGTMKILVENFFDVKILDGSGFNMKAFSFDDESDLYSTSLNAMIVGVLSE